VDRAGVDGMSILVSLLIFIVTAAVVLWLVGALTNSLPIDPVPRQLIMAVVVLLLLLWLLQHFNLLPL
jgi:hypothetical protein